MDINPYNDNGSREFSSPEDFRGVFYEGYTDEDLENVLSQFRTLTTLRLIGIFDFVDEWGPGGDSDLYLLREGNEPGKLRGVYECPDALKTFLFESEDEGLSWEEIGSLCRKEDGLRRLRGTYSSSVKVNDHCRAWEDRRELPARRRKSKKGKR